MSWQRKFELQLTPTEIGSRQCYIDLVVCGALGRYVAAHGTMSIADAHELADELERARGIGVKYMEWAQIGRSP